MTGPHPSSHRVQFHFIAGSVSAFELSSPRDEPANLILWIGGLFDTLGNVSYPFTLANRLPVDWSLFHLALSSSGNSWGTSTLDHDVTEMAAAVTHFRKEAPHRRIIIMGHSTGSQDALHYVCSDVTGDKGARPTVDGIILQAPVSDREALTDTMEPGLYAQANLVAKQYIDDGRPDDCLPNYLPAAAFGEIDAADKKRVCGITARRWLSLASPDKNGQDDYFSSDLSVERLVETFGRVRAGTKILVLYGGNDEYVPKHVRPVDLINRWKDFAEKSGAVFHPDSTRLLEGASHNLNGDPAGVVEELIRRVNSFLDALNTL